MAKNLHFLLLGLEARMSYSYVRGGMFALASWLTNTQAGGALVEPEQ